ADPRRRSDGVVGPRRDRHGPSRSWAGAAARRGAAGSRRVARRRRRGPLRACAGPRGPGPHGRGGDRRTARPGAEPGSRAGAGMNAAAGRSPAGRRGALTPKQTREQIDAQARRTLDRQRLRAAHAAFDQVSPAVGQLDATAFRKELARDGDAAVALLAEMAVATDPVLRREARRLANRLLPALGRAASPRRRGTRRIVSRAGALEGDLDLDRTLERSLGRRPQHAHELVARQFAAAPRAVCLLVDRSGSMSGHAGALAAVAGAAVVSARGERLRCSVVAFSSEPLVLLSDLHVRPAGGGGGAPPFPRRPGTNP